MAQQTAATVELAEQIRENDVDATAHDGDQRTVVVERDDSTFSASGVEALAERNGYFIFAKDANEYTLVAYEDCAWKPQGA
jgi:hypothetical protein